MTRSRLITDMVREILHTKKRFLSLFVMSFLAVGFLAGLRMTAPDMQTTLDHYYDRQHFMDVRLISMLGLTEDDLQAVSELPGVSMAEGSRSFDALLEEDSVTVFSIPEKLNLLDLVEGRMPETPDECVTEAKILEAAHKKIGDTITIDTKESFNRVMQDDPLAQSGAVTAAGESGNAEQTSSRRSSTKHTYTIVGIARSPLYISITRENSKVGSGNTTGFVVLPEECFTQDYYSQIYLELEGLSQYNCYRDDEYEDLVDAFIDEIKPFSKERARIRKSQVSDDMSFADLAALVISGIAESGSSGASAMAGLTGSNGDWYILGRNTIRSYVEFSEDSDRMSDLANVFPLIFFMVAALSSLTSMTRMVEDHRAEIGTLKSLGFSTLSISIKYIGYALAASLLGGGAGLLFGCRRALFGGSGRPCDSRRRLCGLLCDAVIQAGGTPASPCAETRQADLSGVHYACLEEAFLYPQGQRAQPFPLQEAFLDDDRRNSRLHSAAWLHSAACDRIRTERFDLRCPDLAV